MKVKKIVLTGGPCAGKTTALQQIEREFTERGYHVLMVPEAASILISAGIRPFGPYAMDMAEFQKYVIGLQMDLENYAETSAENDSNPCLIVCDRGILDDRAYVSEKVWNNLLNAWKVTNFDLMNRYDLVLHLRTAALGKEEFYTLDNNNARTETPAEAREKDQKTLEAWLGHEKLKVIGNEMTFQDKIRKVVEEIYRSLEKPYPLQIQYKYLVSNLDPSKLNQLQFVKLELEQYITEENGTEKIYRKTGRDGEEKYTVITKMDTDIAHERITTSRLITDVEYYQNMPLKMTPIRKTRYCFEYQNQYFRLDRFENGLQLLEVEPTTVKQPVALPDFMTIEKEVTDDVWYRNSSVFKRQNSFANCSNQKLLQKKLS